jgi:hypothetical protein
MAFRLREPTRNKSQIAQLFMHRSQTLLPSHVARVILLKLLGNIEIFRKCR